MAVKKTTKKAKTVKQTPPPFFETTPLKLVIMSLCTFGLYQAYWFYKMWRTANPNSTKKAAIICALLNRLFLYELLKTLQVPYAIWLAIMYFAIGFTLQSNSIWGFVASYASVIPLVYVQMRLNNRLKKPVKASFTRRSITWAIVGLIATAGFMIGVSYLNGKVDQNAATAQPTAQHTVAKQNTKDHAASTAAQQDQTSTATTPSSTSANNADASKPAATTPTKSTPTGATTPTTYPMADPAKIKQYAASFDPYPNNPQIIGATVSLNNACGYSGYHYDLRFIQGAKAGTFAAHWEVVSGTGSVPTFPWLDLGPGTVGIYDTLEYGFSAATSPYTVRLHITSPNDFYSNPLTIVSCS